MSCIRSCSASRSKCCCASGLHHSIRFASFRIATPSGNAAVACSICCSSAASSSLVWLCCLTILYSRENTSSQTPPASGMVSRRASCSQRPSLYSCRAWCAITISNTSNMNSNAGVAENTIHSSNANSATSAMGVLRRSQKSCNASPKLIDGKTITATAHSLDQTVHSGRFQRGAQAANMHVHCAFLDEYLRTPHLIEQLCAAVHALRMGHEKMQQAKFGGAEFYCPALCRHAVRNRRQLQAAGRNRFIRHLRNKPPQHGTNARHQFAWREWLGDVVICA